MTSGPYARWRGRGNGSPWTARPTKGKRGGEMTRPKAAPQTRPSSLVTCHSRPQGARRYARWRGRDVKGMVGEAARAPTVGGMEGAAGSRTSGSDAELGEKVEIRFRRCGILPRRNGNCRGRRPHRKLVTCHLSLAPRGRFRRSAGASAPKAFQARPAGGREAGHDTFQLTERWFFVMFPGQRWTFP